MLHTIRIKCCTTIYFQLYFSSRYDFMFIWYDFVVLCTCTLYTESRSTPSGHYLRNMYDIPLVLLPTDPVPGCYVIFSVCLHMNTYSIERINQWAPFFIPHMAKYIYQGSHSFSVNVI